MVFPTTHTLLTFNWNTALGEVGQTGIRVNQSTLPTLTQMNAVHSAWGIFWSAVNARINVEFVFTNVKAAIIRPDGTYPPDVEPIYSTGAVVAGNKTSGPYYPLQVACAATLTTNFVRGHASKGRMYLPPIAQVLDASSFRWAGTTMAERASSLASALSGINGVLDGSLCVMSRVGAGEVNLVAGVQVGNRADVQRSRDKRNPETYSAISAVTL